MAQAARAVQVPLTTLVSAVKQARIPSLRMPDQRHYVQIRDVQAYFVNRVAAKREILSALSVTGILIPPKSNAKLKRIKPIKVSGKPVSQILIEDRERL